MTNFQKEEKYFLPRIRMLCSKSVFGILEIRKRKFFSNHNLRAEIRNQKRNRKTEIRNQNLNQKLKSEIRNQKSEIGNQKSEIRSHEIETGNAFTSGKMMSL